MPGIEVTEDFLAEFPVLSELTFEVVRIVQSEEFEIPPEPSTEDVP